MPNENWTLFLMNMFFVLCVDMCNSACNVCIMCTQCIFTPHFLSTYLKTRRWMSSIGAGCWGSESSPVSTTPRKYTTLCVSLHCIVYSHTYKGMRVDDIWIHMSWKRMQRDLSSQILSFPVSAGRERRFLIFLVDKPARLIIRKSWKDNGCILLPQSKKTLLPKTFVAVKFGESSRQTATASI